MAPIYPFRWSVPFFLIGGLVVGHLALRRGRPGPALPPVVVADCSKRHVIDIPIDIQLLEDLLSRQSALARQMRIVPWIGDGKPQGFRVYAVRRGSLAWHLGMRNGDIIRTVNGLDVTSPDKCLEAYSRLRSSDLVVVELLRAGVVHELRYHIFR
jgi:general secretion pathway protein C